MPQGARAEKTKKFDGIEDLILPPLLSLKKIVPQGPVLLGARATHGEDRSRFMRSRGRPKGADIMEIDGPMLSGLSGLHGEQAHGRLQVFHAELGDKEFPTLVLL